MKLREKGKYIAEKSLNCGSCFEDAIILLAKKQRDQARHIM